MFWLWSLLTEIFKIGSCANSSWSYTEITLKWAAVSVSYKENQLQVFLDLWANTRQRSCCSVYLITDQFNHWMTCVGKKALISVWVSYKLTFVLGYV